MSNDWASPRSRWPAAKRLALLLVLVLVLLGVFVSQWFTFAAMGLWIGLIIAGRGACPLGTCGLPPREK